CAFVAAVDLMRSRHREGHAACPLAADGTASQVFNASDMQRGERSPAAQPLSTLDGSSQALRSLAYAAENPAMLRTMRPCGSLSALGSNPEISTVPLSSAESIAFGHSAAVRISIFPDEVAKGRSMRDRFRVTRSGASPAAIRSDALRSRAKVRRIAFPTP